MAGPDGAVSAAAAPGSNAASGVASSGYRWYVGSQVLSIVGTMMSYTALFWLALHIRYGGAPALAAVDAAQCLPILLFSRRAGIIVARHRAARVAMITQGLQAGQTLMLDLVGPGELRRGSSLFATVTGLAKIAGPGVAGIVIAAGGETAVFFINAASFLGVIAVLARLSGRLTPAEAPGREATVVRRLRWLLDLPPGGPGRRRAGAARRRLRAPVRGDQPADGQQGLPPRLGRLRAIRHVHGGRRDRRELLLLAPQGPRPAGVHAWSGVFGVAECVAAVMPVAWAYDGIMIALGAATQLFAASATVYVLQATPAAQRGPALSAYNAGFIGFVPGRRVRRGRDRHHRRARWALIGPGLAVAVGAIVFAVRTRRS